MYQRELVIVYSLLLFMIFRNNKKTIIMTPTTEMIPLFQFFLNSIGGSVIPVVNKDLYH